MSEYKVNLFIPGVGKAGTSSLHMYLNQHPNICMSTIKEPHFFAVDAQYIKGAQFHNSLFNCDAKKDVKYFGESSTTYFLSEAAIERIKANIKNPRFIFLLRNPIDRIYSHFYWIANAMGEKVLPFEEEIAEDMVLKFDPNLPLKSGAYKYYIQESSYGSAIEKYINRFGKENIHLVTTERLKSEPLKVLNECFEFLELPPMDKIIEKHENATPPARRLTTPSVLKRISFLFPDGLFRSAKNKILDKFYTRYEPVPVITESQRKWLKAILTPEVDKLRSLTGKQFREWPEFNT